ncbi:glycosyl transferase, partial [Plesiomonas shigelloides]|uniref:glycosyltransferase n=1 Tax=Plesiomonas shigelloides TaxID=703 RepID=UPI000D56F533
DKAVNIIGIKENKIIMSLNSITPLKPRGDADFHGRVLFVGRLTYPKRPDLIADVVARDKRYSLDIIGDGDLYPELYRLYGECDNISFLGEIAEFRDFNKYDVFVLTSDSEGLPMSALEAASAGVPMILSNVGGCFEVINGENGILVKNEALDISEALNIVADNYAYYLDNAIKYRREFDISAKAHEYKCIIL